MDWLGLVLPAGDLGLRFQLLDTWWNPWPWRPVVWAGWWGPPRPFFRPWWGPWVAPVVVRPVPFHARCAGGSDDARVVPVNRWTAHNHFNPSNVTGIYRRWGRAQWWRTPAAGATLGADGPRLPRARQATWSGNPEWHALSATRWTGAALRRQRTMGECAAADGQRAAPGSSRRRRSPPVRGRFTARSSLRQNTDHDRGACRTLAPRSESDSTLSRGKASARREVSAPGSRAPSGARDTTPPPASNSWSETDRCARRAAAAGFRRAPAAASGCLGAASERPGAARFVAAPSRPAAAWSGPVKERGPASAVRSL